MQLILLKSQYLKFWRWVVFSKPVFCVAHSKDADKGDVQNSQSWIEDKWPALSCVVPQHPPWLAWLSTKASFRVYELKASQVQNCEPGTQEPEAVYSQVSGQLEQHSLSAPSQKMEYIIKVFCFCFWMKNTFLSFLKVNTWNSDIFQIL